MINGRKLLSCALTVGENMLTSGAEVGRVEDTVTRICRAYGAKHVNVLTITSSIVASAVFEDDKSVTETRRITKQNTNFERLDYLNSLSREICSEKPEIAYIEKKLDAIQETQEEILEFLEEKERAVLQGNLNVLGDVMSNFKYNWNNDTYKTNKHILVQQIKKEAEASIILYRDQIAKKLKKRSLIHSDQEVKGTLKKLQAQFKDYQLALYLYSYSTFLEVMLLGNFSEGYLDSVEQRISEYSFQYRSLYTECYSLMEDYSKSSIQSGMLSGLAVASKFMGETIAKVPVISKSQLDENLIEAGGRLGRHGEKRATVALEGLAQTRMSVTLPFVENIRAVNDLYNKPVVYLFDRDNVYIQQIAD